MAVTFFCPFCGKATTDEEKTCSRCGNSIERWREFPFEERLLLTLRHPIVEYRMMAIQLLGQRRYARAVPIFTEMISTERDVYILREIAFALARIGTPESRRVLEQLNAHKSPVVRCAIEEIQSASGEGDPA
jgi:HEAT repeat protein